MKHLESLEIYKKNKLFVVIRRLKGKPKEKLNKQTSEISHPNNTTQSLKVWREENGFVKASFWMAKKLIALKAAIKEWVQEERVRVEEGINWLLEELESLDLEEGEGRFSREKGERRVMVRAELANRLCKKFHGNKK